MSIRKQLTALIVSVVFCIYGAEAAPWHESDLPDCSSNSGLCDMTYEVQQNPPYRSSPVVYPSSTQLCKCPGKRRCPNNAKNSSKVLNLELQSPGQTVRVKLSYCTRRSVPKKICKANEFSVSLRGVGPITPEIVGDVMCKCKGPLKLHRTKPDGVYSILEYTCGRPTCRVNQSIEPVCERVTRRKTQYGLETSSVIPCECPDGFHCAYHTVGSSRSLSTEFHCQPDTGFNKY